MEDKTSNYLGNNALKEGESKSYDSRSPNLISRSPQQMNMADTTPSQTSEAQDGAVNKWNDKNEKSQGMKIRELLAENAALTRKNLDLIAESRRNAASAARVEQLQNENRLLRLEMRAAMQSKTEAVHRNNHLSMVLEVNQVDVRAEEKAIDDAERAEVQARVDANTIATNEMAAKRKANADALEAEQRAKQESEKEEMARLAEETQIADLAREDGEDEEGDSYLADIPNIDPNPKNH